MSYRLRREPRGDSHKLRPDQPTGVQSSADRGGPRSGPARICRETEESRSGARDLDVAVALVKALGHDTEARGLANTNVTSGGQTITDNAQIPGNLRGYVQVALNLGLFEAFPAGIVQVSPGVYQAVPGPRFEPATTMTRATLAVKLGAFGALFTTGG